MQKAKSFKQNKPKNDLSPKINMNKMKSEQVNPTESMKSNKNPNISKIESSSKELLVQKKSKMKIRRKC